MHAAVEVENLNWCVFLGWAHLSASFFHSRVWCGWLMHVLYLSWSFNLILKTFTASLECKAHGRKSHFKMIRNWIFLSRTWLRNVDWWLSVQQRWLFLPLKVFVSACDPYQSYFSRFCENFKPFQWLESLKDNGKRDVIPIFQDTFSHIVVPYQRWWFNMNNPNDGVYFSKIPFHRMCDYHF